MRTSIVARAERSDAARRKQTTGRTDDGLPVHSFKSLLADLATYSRIQATTALNEKYVFTLHTRPTPIQQRAFELLAINPDRTQYRPSPSTNESEINGLSIERRKFGLAPPEFPTTQRRRRPIHL